MTRVDAHLHVWQAAEGTTHGVQTIVSPERDVPIASAIETLRDHHVDRAVLVQPLFRGEDNHYVARCAQAEPARLAAVCVVDPRIAGADLRLQAWVEQGCRGLRLRPHVAAEEECFGDPSTFPLWEAASRLGVVVSLLCGPAHAPRIAALAERFPDVPIVVDHLGYPDVAAGVDAPGFRQMLSLARHPRVFMKTSGFHHFSREAFPFVDCWPFVRAVYDHFGPERLLWGSDYPHVVATCGYAHAAMLPQQALADWPAWARDRILGLNALELYWL